MEVWVGTGTSRPETAACSLSNGTSEDTVDDILFRIAVGHDIYIDQVLVDDASVESVSE